MLCCFGVWVSDAIGDGLSDKEIDKSRGVCVRNAINIDIIYYVESIIIQFINTCHVMPSIPIIHIHIKLRQSPHPCTYHTDHARNFSALAP